MPTHFKTMKEFRDLITKHGAREVVVSRDDFDWLWDRVEPKMRGPNYNLRVENDRYEIVIIKARLSGVLNLTEDSIKIIEDE